MNAHSYFLVSGILFGVLALVHVVRVIDGWTFTLGPYAVPMAASVVAILVTGVLSFFGFKLSRQKA